MQLKLQSLLAALFILALTSCKKDADLSGNVSTLSLTSIQQQQVVAANTFTFKLFNNVAASNSNTANLLLSPLSVSIAMAITSNGANGTTRDGINSALNFTGYTQAQVNSFYNKLITALPQLAPNTTLKIANSIWYAQTFSVLPQFLQTNTQYYQATVQPLDFTSPASVNTINNWASTQTSGKIPSIINQIPPDAVMYLINAVYFKSTWNEKFDVSRTNQQTFFLADNTTVQTDFMNGTVDCNAYSDNNVNVVELPYANKKYSMVLVTPPNGNSVASLVANTTQATWQSWMQQLTARNEMVILPKFKFSYATSLNSALTALGMGNAFADGADFSNISPTGLKISKVQHSTYIGVDEDGTEAAAVTSVGIVASVALPNTIVFNHPFLFAIREMSSGLILFTGIVNNPAGN